MRLILLMVCLPVLAQQKLSAPVTIGGVDCGEIRLREAFATGTSYATWKACQDSFGEVQTSLTSSTGHITFIGGELGNLFFGAQQFRPLAGTDGKIIISYPSGDPVVDLKNAGGSNAITLQPTGIVLEQQAAAPSTPDVGQIIVYAYSAQSGLCSKDSAGTELCMGGSAANMVTTDTTQTISGAKSFVAPLIVQTSGGAAKILLQTVSSRGIVTINDASGLGGLTLDGTGDVSTDRQELNLSQYGDAIGSSSLTLKNRVGINGGELNVSSVDVADWSMCGSSGGCMSMRNELRTGSGLTYLNPTKKEFQFFNPTGTYPNSIGLLANEDGIGLMRGDYFRMLGATSGYAGLVAPSVVTSYTLSMPAATSTTGKLLCLDSATALGWCSPAAASSTLSTPVVFQTAGVTEVVFALSAGRMVAQIYNSAGGVGVDIDSEDGITLKDTSGTTKVKIDSNASKVEFFNASGVSHFDGGSSSLGGYLHLNTNAGNQAVQIDGSGIGRIRVSDGTSLRTGFTGTVNFSTCTAATVVMGLYITGC